jgi:hypothetical protein
VAQNQRSDDGGLNTSDMAFKVDRKAACPGCRFFLSSGPTGPPLDSQPDISRGDMNRESLSFDSDRLESWRLGRVLIDNEDVVVAIACDDVEACGP